MTDLEFEMHMVLKDALRDSPPRKLPTGGGVRRVVAPITFTSAGAVQQETSAQSFETCHDVAVSGSDIGLKKPVVLSSLNEKKKERAYDFNDIILGEDDIEDESMKKYTSMLFHSVNNSVNYGKGSGLDGTVSEFVEKVDNAMFPLQEGGWFREGMKKTRKTKYLMIHHPGLLSHTYLQTHSDGVLHVLPGWTRKLLISDLAYRFESSATTQHRTAIPILGWLLCTVKTYCCAGVVVCKQCSSNFREKRRHTVVKRTYQSVLACAEELSPAAEAKKKVVGMYLGFEAKKKTRAGFCQAEVRSNERRRVKEMHRKSYRGTIYVETW